MAVIERPGHVRIAATAMHDALAAWPWAAEVLPADGFVGLFRSTGPTPWARSSSAPTPPAGAEAARTPAGPGAGAP
ncbi:hypothetical protein [Streptomyces sp. NPDC001502]|uniref:hypothetical protein n=1 Tax=Streptomyces sp. NPDC001502 TaxID=3364578 RepID=UPI00367E6F5F